MVAVASNMLTLGTKAPDFSLPNENLLYPSTQVRRADFVGKPLLVAFICNHCPYVILINDVMTKLFNDYQEKGLAVIAISSNDTIHYPDDGPTKMRLHAQEHNYMFPYCYDETQQVAKLYKAACTPDFYLFNDHHILEYRGQFDNARPGKECEVNGEDLDDAVRQVLKGRAPNQNQRHSMGCNIKWKAGNEPDYF